MNYIRKLQIIYFLKVTASTFHQWNGVASHLVPLLLAFFLGSYSDKRGRKVILIAGLLGKLYFSVMITINTLTGMQLYLLIINTQKYFALLL